MDWMITSIDIVYLCDMIYLSISNQIICRMRNIRYRLWVLMGFTFISYGPLCLGFI